MKHERQRLTQRELEERIPKGQRGSPQNRFRMQFNAWRLHGLSFEESSARAAEAVREWFDPAFTPQVLPAREDAAGPAPPTDGRAQFAARVVFSEAAPLPAE